MRKILEGGVPSKTRRSFKNENILRSNAGLNKLQLLFDSPNIDSEIQGIGISPIATVLMTQVGQAVFLALPKQPYR